jgi:hypothetical protein
MSQHGTQNVKTHARTTQITKRNENEQHGPPTKIIKYIEIYIDK